MINESAVKTTNSTHGWHLKEQIFAFNWKGEKGINEIKLYNYQLHF